MKRFMKRASEKISKLSDEQIERILDALNDENDKFASILESISTGIIILDKDWNVLLTNKAAERYVPFTSAKDKKSVWELIADESVSAFLKKCHDDDKANASEEFSLQLFGSSAVRFVTVSLMPLVQKKGEKTLVTGSIVKIDDNTEKRKQDILLHRMESLASLTNLAANVAHEIKNPLGAISIHIQLLQKALKRARSSDGRLPEPKFMEERLDVVNEEIENLNKVIMDFLFAVRPVKAELVLAEPDALVSHFATFFIDELKSRGIHFETRLNAGATRLLIDEKLFRQVVANIEQNAIAAIIEKFGENKGGEMRIESEIKDGVYEIRFCDNGEGMSEETASHIFEPYFTTKVNGTGLGMTMVYKIVREFAGDISVKSEKGKGTQFTIRLNVPQADKPLLTCNKEDCLAIESKINTLRPFIDAAGTLEQA